MTEEFSNKPLQADFLSEGPSESALPAGAEQDNASGAPRGPMTHGSISFDEPENEVVTSTPQLRLRSAPPLCALVSQSQL